MVAIISRNRLRKQRKFKKRLREAKEASTSGTSNLNGTASRACDKVFTTPKLLESILLELHPHDLLISQRINTAFREVISSSPSIQRRLFFKARLSTDGDGHERTLNPFLPYVLRRNFRRCDIYLATGEPGQKTRAQGAIGERQQDIWWSPVKIQPEQFLLAFLEACMVSRAHRKTAVHENDHESWRKMLVADGPCLLEIRQIDMHTLAMMKSALPETLGDVAELLEELDERKAEAENRALKAYHKEVWAQYRSQMI